MEDSLKLSYCPFCGSTHVKIEPDQDADGYTWYYAVCQKCYTRSDSYCDEETAANMWNKRSLTIDGPQPENSILTADCGNMPLEKQFQIIGEAAYLFATSISKERENKNFAAINLLVKILNDYKSDLLDRLVDSFHKTEICKIAMHRGDDEYTIQYMFDDYANLVIPGAKVIQKKHDGKNIPDAWIKLNGEEIPVEVKFQYFNEKAMNQLNRYVKAYKCNRGVAVGRELTADLPEGYIFVSIDELKAAQKAAAESKEN